MRASKQHFKICDRSGKVLRYASMREGFAMIASGEADRPNERKMTLVLASPKPAKASAIERAALETNPQFVQGGLTKTR